MDKVTELLEEIQAICIGADSPDAIEHGKINPTEEIQELLNQLMEIK